MSPQTDRAIVLRLVEYSETSQIVSLFTAEHGLLRLIARGSRRSSRTRFAAGLDLLESGDVSFLPARGDAQLGTLTEWVQTDTFGGLRRETLRLYAALYAVELLVALTEEADPHPGLFDTLLRTLGALAGAGPVAPQLPRFQAALLKAIGYTPNFDACVGCRRPVPRSGPIYFSAGAGGLLCRDCEMHHVEKRRIRTGLLGSQPGEANHRDWFELLDYHLTHVAGRRFKTATQLETLLAREPGERL